MSQCVHERVKFVFSIELEFSFGGLKYFENKTKRYMNLVAVVVLEQRNHNWVLGGY